MISRSIGRAAYFAPNTRLFARDTFRHKSKKQGEREKQIDSKSVGIDREIWRVERVPERDEDTVENRISSVVTDPVGDV